MISFRHIPILLLSLFLAPSVSAATLQELQDLVERERFDEAYLMAKAMSRASMGNADFDFLYGIVSRATGHPEVAVFAFERILMQNPVDARVMYEHAQSLIEISDLQGAAVELQGVLALDTITEDLRQNAMQVLDVVMDALMVLERETIFATSVSLEAGFNSNVNSGTSGTPIPNIQNTEFREGYVNLGATGLIKKQLNRDQAFYFTVASDNRKNFQSVIWDSNSVSAEFGAEFTFNEFTLRLPFGADVSFGNYAIDRVGAALTPDVTYAWSSGNFTTVSFGFAPKFFTSDPSINYYSFPLTISHWSTSIVPGAGISTSLNYNPGLKFSKVINTVVHDEVSLSLSGSFEIAPSHFLNPSINLMYLYYPLNGNATAVRHDANVTVQMAYEWRLTENWSANLSYMFNYGYSTDIGQTYIRHQPQLGLRFQL